MLFAMSLALVTLTLNGLWHQFFGCFGDVGGGAFNHRTLLDVAGADPILLTDSVKRGQALFCRCDDFGAFGNPCNHRFMTPELWRR